MALLIKIIKKLNDGRISSEDKRKKLNIKKIGNWTIKIKV
jgi:hypothetical protein